MKFTCVSVASLNLTSTAHATADFGHASASYQPPVGMEQSGTLNFSGNLNFSEESLLARVSPSSGLSHLEESGSSEVKMAGWTGLEPAAFRVTGGRYNQLNYHPARTAPELSAVCHRNQDL